MVAKSLAEKTVDLLLDYFKKENLQVGSKLPNEFKLAEQLKVGRSTLREAIRILVAQNVVAVRQGSGTYIVNLEQPDEGTLDFEHEDSLKLTKDLFEVRFLLEPRMASLAAQHISKIELKELERLMLALEEEIMSVGEIHRSLDIQFHTVIAEASRNVAMKELVPIIIQSIALYNDYFTTQESKKETIRAHREIFKAIQARDPQRAYDAMVRHMSDNRLRLEER